MAYDYAVHSDFLIHWTGKDLDESHDPCWIDSDKSNTDSNVALNEAYLERLRNILRFGLWLTEEDELILPLPGGKVSIPNIPKTCFTELRLSESRKHASRYGRLGIGVKRPYVFRRFGRPLAYFGFNTASQEDVFLQACAQDLQDKRLLNFFKPMNTSLPLEYDLYAESEWRILFFEELLKERRLIDPRDEKKADSYEYFKKLSAAEQQKLRYLAPLDGWFQVIIYPSLRIKNLAQQDTSYGIREEISRIKERSNDHGNRVEGGNWPMEMDLDACRNF
ncbi:MAG: hypothetical protein WAM60_07780 [Candidatus Promineifilaceae bacterium]